MEDLADDVTDDVTHLGLDENENRAENRAEEEAAEAQPDKPKKTKPKRKVGRPLRRKWRPGAHAHEGTWVQQTGTTCQCFLCKRLDFFLQVSFADAAGKELAQVKVFEQPEPELPVPREPEPELEPLQLLCAHVTLESAPEDFRRRFEKNHLILEKLNLGTVSVAGRVRVRGADTGSETGSGTGSGADRRVSVRSTTTAWMSYTKQQARFIQPVPKFEPDTKTDRLAKKEKKRKSSKEGHAPEDCPHDSYCFEISVDRHAQALQFYVTSCDPHGRPEYEDNNEGEMYTVLNPNYIEPIEEKEEEEEDEEEAGWAALRGGSEWDNDYY